MIEQIKKSVMLFNAPIQRVYQANRGTIIRTVIYTIGHFVIAASCVMYFTGASFSAAITDAIVEPCLLYTSPSPRDRTRSRMPSSA